MAKRLPRLRVVGKAREPEGLSVLPMQLRVGDRFTDETGTWEVVGQPTTQRAGKEVKARVQQPGEPATARDQWWPAYQCVTVTR